ncbi:MAG TPA: helix-turn-helix domain-containing protein, partial [Planctomycetota bacterium]|nr:helix-turn-helix domain-containing protein [Planctomycetota bacterium]
MTRTTRIMDAGRPPARRRAGFVAIDRSSQLEALASPLRQEIVDVLDAAGPCSIAELAQRLGRPPDSLYFHLRRLVKTGLVVEVERRRAGRHAFVVVDVAGRPMRIDRAKARPAHMQAVVGGILRLAARDFRRGHGQTGTEVAGAARNHAAARVRG